MLQKSLQFFTVYKQKKGNNPISSARSSPWFPWRIATSTFAEALVLFDFDLEGARLESRLEHRMYIYRGFRGFSTVIYRQMQESNILLGHAHFPSLPFEFIIHCL